MSGAGLRTINRVLITHNGLVSIVPVAPPHMAAMTCAYGSWPFRAAVSKDLASAPHQQRYDKPLIDVVTHSLSSA